MIEPQSAEDELMAAANPVPSPFQTKEFTDDDDKVVKVLEHAWATFTGYYGDVDKTTAKVLNFYNGTIPEEYTSVYDETKKEWVKGINSSARIGWTHRGVNQLADEVSSTLISTNEFFDIAPTPGSETAIKVCERVCTSLLHNAGIQSFMNDTIRTWLLFGEVGVYVDWAGGGREAISLCRIPYRYIRHTPVYEPEDRANLSYVKLCTKQELLDSDDGYYYNVMELEDPPADSIPQSNPSTSQVSAAVYPQPGPGEIRVVSSYIPEITIGERTYTNVFAVVADEKILLQFEPNMSHEEFHSRAHIRACREKFVDAVWGPVNVGQSVAHQAIDLELAAYVVHNLSLDSAKLNVHAPRTYDVQDTTLKTYIEAHPLDAFAPGAMVPRGMPGQPIETLATGVDMLSFSIQYLQKLEQEFILAIGVPGFNGGVGTDDKRVAATAKQMQASYAAVRMKALIEEANRQILLPIVYRVYYLVAMAFNAGEMDELAQQICPTVLNEAMIRGQIAPLLRPEKFKMTTYESPIARSERIQALQTMMPQLMQLEQAYPGIIQASGQNPPDLLRKLFSDLGFEPSAPLGVNNAQPDQQAMGPAAGDPAAGGAAQAGSPPNPGLPPEFGPAGGVPGPSGPSVVGPAIN